MKDKTLKFWCMAEPNPQISNSFSKIVKKVTKKRLLLQLGKIFDFSLLFRNVFAPPTAISSFRCRLAMEEGRQTPAARKTPHNSSRMKKEHIRNRQ
jgi:hypothetical protein